MLRGLRKRWILLVAVLVVGALALGSVLIPGSPTRFLAAALTNHECFLAEADSDARPIGIGLGDSITRGHELTWINGRASDSYFDTLACEDNSPIAFGGNAGVWGQTTDQIRHRVDDVLDKHPDVVFLLAGANDIRGGDTAASVYNIAFIVDTLSGHDVRVILGTTTPLNDQPDDVRAFNEALTTWAQTAPVTLVDYWSAVAAPDGRYRDGLTRDGIHPNAAGAELMAQAALAGLRQRAA